MNTHQVIDDQPEGYDSENSQEINKLQKILEEIKEGYLDDDKQILEEIIPVYQKLNQRNQNYFKYQLHHEFQDYSFIQNQLFQSQNKLQQVEDYKTLYQKMKGEQNWKALLIQLSNEKFCQFNNFPKTWSSKENLKVLQNHEFILEKILNLNELCSKQNGYHYIEVTELLIVLFDYALKQEQDGNTICQIIGSTLRVQLYQFQQFKSALRDKNQKLYEKMVQDIQQYQLKQVSEINLSQYSQEFQLVIKICISNWNVKSFESYLNNYFKFNFKESSMEQLQFQIQEIVQNKMIEEIYFSLVFFYYTQYCNIYNFQKVKNILDEQLTKLKNEKERQIKQIERSIQKFDSQDEIQMFLVNKFFNFQDFQLKTECYEETYKSLQNLQIESEKQLQPFSNMKFQQILQDQDSLKQVSQSILFLPQIRISQLFVKDKLVDITFLLFNYLKSYASEYEELLKFLQSQQEQTFHINIEYLQNSYKRTKNKQLTIYTLIFMNQLNSFLNSNSQFYIQIFKIENSFQKATLIKSLLKITEENQINLSGEILQDFYNKNSKDWQTIENVLGSEKIDAVFKFFFQSYLSQEQLTINQKKLMFKVLIELKHNIKITKDYKIKLLNLPEQDFNSLVNQMQNLKEIQEESVFDQVIKIIHDVLKGQNQQDQEKMIDFLESNFKQKKNFDFNGMKRLIRNNIKLEKMYQSQLIYYQKVKMNGKLEAKAKQFYDEDPKSYQLLFEAENFYNCFLIHPRYLQNCNTQSIYPKQSKISLEDFNISLSEMTEEAKQKLINEWIQNMNNEKYFSNLIPFYFNVIKRNEHPKSFLSFLNKNEKQKQLKLNMKAMFQIFYNNSNQELQSMLLKLWSAINPIPLLFSNPHIDQIKSLQDLFQINEKVAFVFPECYPIINLSFSKKQSSFGKTFLINKIFYRADMFEVSDSCELNQNTIDIMFDFCFNETRNLAIADVHGSIPIDILIKILPLFKIWIVQVDSEDELQENYNEMKKIQQSLQYQSLLYQPLQTIEYCFVVRNCKNTNKSSDVEKQIQSETFSIHKIIDLTQKGLDQQTINTEIEKFQNFIFKKIKNLSKKELKNSDDFLNLLSSYYSRDHPQIKQIDQDNQLLKQLDQELEKLVKDPQGFYSEQSFPIRSLMWQIKNHKQDMKNLDHLNKEKSKEQIENTKNKIQDLEKKIPSAIPTKILELFQQIFKSQNQYILYLKFTEKIRKFNQVHTQKLQENNLSINEELKIIKEKKQSIIKIGQNDIQQSDQDVNSMKDLKKQLEDNLKAIDLINTVKKNFQSFVKSNFNHYLIKHERNKTQIYLYQAFPHPFIYKGDFFKLNSQKLLNNSTHSIQSLELYYHFLNLYSQRSCKIFRITNLLLL